MPAAQCRAQDGMRRCGPRRSSCSVECRDTGDQAHLEREHGTALRRTLLFADGVVLLCGRLQRLQIWLRLAQDIRDECNHGLLRGRNSRFPLDSPLAHVRTRTTDGRSVPLLAHILQLLNPAAPAPVHVQTPDIPENLRVLCLQTV